MITISKIETDLAPSEVAMVLAKSIDIEKTILWSPMGSKSVLGYVKESRFRLHQRISYRNGFQTYCYGSIRQRANGSEIDLRFRASTATIFFCLFALLWCGGVSINLFALPQGLLPILLIGCLFWIGRFIARNEKAFLLQFIEKALLAETSMESPNQSMHSDVAATRPRR